MSNKRLNAAITIGGAITGSLRSALGTTTRSLDKIGDSVKRLSREQRTLGDGIKTLGRQGMNIDGLRTRYAAVTKELERQRRVQIGLANIEAKRQANLANRASIRGRMLDMAIVGGALSVPVRQAVAHETAMLGVAKQLDGARDASGKLTAKYYEMDAAIKQLGREVPIATDKIAGMVEASLRMGVAGDEVLGFVKTVAMASTALELNEEETADSMGKIANLYKIPVQSVNDLVDRINYLDDKTQSTAGGVIDFMTRVGGVAGSVKIGATQIAALGSTLLTLGERAETASTATNAMLQKLAAASKGPKKLQAALKEVGLSASGIEAGMQQDAMGTMLKVLDAVNKLPASKRTGVLVDMFGLEHSDTAAKLVTNTKELRHQMELANSEAAKGSAQREFAARLETTAAQAQMTKNKINELSAEIGANLLPVIKSLMESIGPVVSSFAQWARENPGLTKGIIGATAGLWAFRAAGMALGYAATFAVGGALKLAAAAVRLAPAIRLVGTALAFVGRTLLLNPIGLAVAGIAGAAYLIYEKWEPLKAWFGNLWAEITATFQKSLDWISEKIKWVGDAWTSTKQALGFGDEQASVMDGHNTSTPPVPVARWQSKAAEAALSDNRTINMTVNAAPGMSAEEVADIAVRKMDYRQGVRQRSQAYDLATP